VAGDGSPGFILGAKPERTVCPDAFTVGMKALKHFDDAGCHHNSYFT
jgi:hypothetical protein